MDIREAHIAQQWTYSSPLLACRFAPDGQQLVSSAEDSTLQRWDLSNGEQAVLRGHESWVHAIQFTSPGEQLISGGCDGRLIWWPIADATPQPLRKLDAHAGWIRALDLHPHGQQLVSVGNDLMIRLWDVDTGEKMAEWKGHDKHIYSVAFHPQGDQLLSGDLSGTLKLWDLASKQLVRQFDAQTLHSYKSHGNQPVDFGGIRDLTLLPTAGHLLAGGLHKATNPLGAVHEPLVLRFGLDTGELLHSHHCEGIPQGMVGRLKGLPDGTAMALCSGGSGSFLLFFDHSQEKDVHRFKLPTIARDMDWHAASERVATAHYDRQLRIIPLFAKS
ncbi:MAG: WD40 repeat domain-containing protein [Planctomycetales bacterium]|nr:WD40 repeat domain-containing protein [Planctomycetales bacterium]